MKRNIALLALCALILPANLAMAQPRETWSWGEEFTLYELTKEGQQFLLDGSSRFVDSRSDIVIERKPTKIEEIESLDSSLNPANFEDKLVINVIAHRREGQVDCQKYLAVDKLHHARWPGRPWGARGQRSRK